MYIEAALSRAVREGESDLIAFLRRGLGMPPCRQARPQKNGGGTQVETKIEPKPRPAFKPFTCACGRKFASRQAMAGHKRSCKK